MWWSIRCKWDSLIKLSHARNRRLLPPAGRRRPWPRLWTSKVAWRGSTRIKRKRRRVGGWSNRGHRRLEGRPGAVLDGPRGWSGRAGKSMTNKPPSATEPTALWTLSRIWLTFIHVPRSSWGIRVVPLTETSSCGEISAAASKVDPPNTAPLRHVRCTSVRGASQTKT